MRRLFGFVVAIIFVIPVWAADAGSPVASSTDGKKIFLKYCANCHGRHGLGDGAAGKLLPTPPYNLSWSTAKDDYLRQLISKGGDAMDRAPEMPAWGKILTPVQIDAVILHLKTLRRTASQ